MRGLFGGAVRRAVGSVLAAGFMAATRAETPPAKTWDFNPPADDYRAEALLDLRQMNEKMAGEGGFVRLAADGNSFMRGDGQPIQFWSVVSDGARMRPEEMEAHCDFLAKRGVNMVRLHLTLCDSKAGAKITDVDEQQLDGVFRFVAAAKKRGIYVTLSPYWASVHAPASWGIEDYTDQELWGLLFFHPKLQDAYMGWIREIYGKVNPYTGIPLRDDPTVAIAQVQNEDSLLFWTFQTIHGAPLRMLQEKFYRWTAAKYGLAERNPWLGVRVPGDQLSEGRLGFEQIWTLTQPPGKGDRELRLRDQTQFMAETQRSFYAWAEKLLRDSGVKALTNACNWRTASAGRLGDIERWTYLPTQLMGLNSYTGGLHEGAANGYRIDPGHYYTNASKLKDPSDLPLFLSQTPGHPIIVSECAWSHPNLYESEAPFMAAAYCGLNGTASVFWFAATVPGWLNDPRRMWWPVGESFAVDKWSICTPTGIAQFPAYAIALRMGYVKATKSVFREERADADLWARTRPAVVEGERFDPNRDIAPAGESDVSSSTIFASSRVEKIYGANASRITSQKPDGGPPELKLDTRQGLLTVKTPCFQGFTGFPVQTPISLGDTEVETQNDYLTLGIVSMDGLPLAKSARILVQAGTTARLTGFQSRPAEFKSGDAFVKGEQIVNTGHPPWQVAATHVKLTVKNPKLTRATLLDANGYPVSDVQLTATASGVALTLPENTLYLILQ